MHLFAIAHSVDGLEEDALARAVEESGRLFGLESRHLLSTKSPGGRVMLASVHHLRRVAEPRRYRAASDSVHVLFDGLPVEKNGQFNAHDARELLERWDDLPDRLEGQFCAVRIDLASEVVDILLDTLGMIRVFAARSNGGWIVSNSVGMVRALSGLATPDEFAVCTSVALGWPVERRTLIDGITSLMGGSLHRVTASGIRSEPRFTPPVVAGLVGAGGHDATDVAHALVELTRSAVREIQPVECAITGGRDSRVNLALAVKSGADVGFYTIGTVSSAWPPSRGICTARNPG